jgi:hypothetical protein
MARSRVNVEQRTETLLRATIVNQLASDSVTGVTHRRFWTSDTSAATESINDKTITYKADPNAPRDGEYHSPYRIVPATVTIITSQASDPKRTTLATVYESVREALDFGSFTDTDIDPVEVMPLPGGSSDVIETDKGWINQVEIPVQVDVNYPGS